LGLSRSEKRLVVGFWLDRKWEISRFCERTTSFWRRVMAHGVLHTRECAHTCATIRSIHSAKMYRTAVEALCIQIRITPFQTRSRILTAVRVIMTCLVCCAV
jgi:hypothetical protein